MHFHQQRESDHAAVYYIKQRALMLMLLPRPICCLRPPYRHTNIYLIKELLEEGKRKKKSLMEVSMGELEGFVPIGACAL